MKKSIQWRKSSRSGQANNCVEVANAQLIRDSKLGDDSPILEVSPKAFRSFIQWTKNA